MFRQSEHLASVFLKLVFVMLPLSTFSLPLNSMNLAASAAGQGIQGRPIAQISFRMSSGLITIPVRINDSKELKMYLDTGMSAAVVVLFHKELIEEVGLKNTQSVLLGGAGAGERKTGILAPGARVRLDGLEMPNQTIIVMDDSRKTSAWHLDGIIGKTLFDKYLTQVDYENCVLSLYEPTEARVGGSFRPIPVNLDLGLPILETTLSLAGQEDIPVKLVVDFGHRNALFLNVNEKRKILAPSRTIKSLAGRGIQGEVAALIGRLPELKLGPFSLKNIPTSFLEPGSNMGLSKDLVDGDIGELVFNRFNIILDYAHKQIYLAANKYFDQPYEYDMTGMVLEQNRDDVYYVLSVIENSPAAENDIIKGDKIVFLNGKDVRDYKYREVFDLLRQEGREVKMTIERENDRFEKTIRLRRLI